MPDVKAVVFDMVRSLVGTAERDPVEITLDSDLFDDLGLDSLQIAELSAVLEETFGSDPYTAGTLARTPREILDFYDSSEG